MIGEKVFKWFGDGYNRFFGEVELPNNSANNAVDYDRLKDKLRGKEIFSEELIGRGTPMAGAGTSTILRDAPRLSAEHGGNPSDWVKMGGISQSLSDGRKIEIHWYENFQIGIRVEFKTKIQ